MLHPLLLPRQYSIAQKALGRELPGSSPGVDSIGSSQGYYNL